MIAGPTGVGKSSLAMDLAERLGGEIVSIDSVQIYRGLDIGSAKPPAADRERIPHHLIDRLDPTQDCNVAEFAALALQAIDEISARGAVPIAVGGTNLYVRVLVHGIFDAPDASPEIRARHESDLATYGVAHLHDELRSVDAILADRIHPNDFIRISRGLEVYELTGRPLSEHQSEHAFKTPNVEALKIAVNRPREELYQRIDARVDAMLAAGFVDEVRALAERGLVGLKPLQSLGYRHIGSYLAGDVEFEEAVRTLKRDTRRFAKQQLSWLRSEPNVVWTLADVDLDELERDVRAFIEERPPVLAWSDPSIASL